MSAGDAAGDTAPRPPGATAAVLGVSRWRHDADRRVAAWLFLAFVVLYVGLTKGHFQSTDEIAVFETTRSLWERGDLDIPPILDSVEGRDGRRYAPYGVGQSLAALPLYGLGTAVERALDRAGAEAVRRALAGPPIRQGATSWGGEVEIFFAGLLHAFTVAALVVLFYAFSRRLDAGVGAAAAAAVLLGTTSYVVPFATSFFQHAGETLALLLVFYLLFRDRQEPAARRRLAAGAAAAALLLVRFPAAVALAPLAIYHVGALWTRRRGTEGFARRSAAVVREALPFALGVLAGVATHLASNVVKFGAGTFSGGYAAFDLGFRTPLSLGLRGLLVSPGKSIFLFTPLMVLLPLTLPPFARRWRAETTALLAVALAYLLLYARYDLWHGAWCFGPRFVAAITPFLLLPLAPWLEHAGAGRSAVAMLAAMGLCMQVLAVAVNFSYVHHHEGYAAFEPTYGFLFDARLAPPAAHLRALLAGDHRVDLWLVQVHRTFGSAALLSIALPWLLVLGCCGWRLCRAVAAAKMDPRP